MNTPMKIRAKMMVTEIARTSNGDERIKLQATYSDTPEDNSYAAATPNASCEMWISNEAVKGFLVPGEKFYVDFTPYVMPVQFQ